MTLEAEQLDLFAQQANQAAKRVNFTKTGRHVQHGTTAGYGHGCRCPGCAQAWRDYQREHKRTKMAQRRPADHSSDPSIPHGTNAGYGQGCRCPACKEARRDYRADRRDIENENGIGDVERS